MTDVNTNNDEKAKLKEELNDSASNEPDEMGEKAKFLNGGKTMDDAHVVVEVSSGDESFTGLGKEELMKYADDPFWKKVRLILFILFWIGWLGMLVAAIVIIVLAPRCPYRPELKWYEKEAVYQVYPKSFKDTTEEAGSGAGIGDIKGIISKLGYIKSLGTKALYINSFYKSGGLDNGLDVVDHQDIDPVLGTMAEFDSLRKQTKTNMRIILDFIPNHTSKKHQWFLSSQKGEAKYRDYYVWKNCTPNALPNNWLSVYGGPAWTYDNVRKECYLHQYLPEEPDLNLNNEDVKKELEKIMRFWLDKGVDGFNVIGAQYLVEDPSMQDETASGSGASSEYNSLDHSFTAHQNGSFELLQRWRSVVDSYATKPGKEKLLLVTLNDADVNTTKKYYGSDGKAGAHIVTVQAVNSETINIPQEILTMIQETAEDHTHRRGWMYGNQDTSRLASVVGKAKVKAMFALQMLLPGTPLNYYGDEIGMENGIVSFAEGKDPVGKKAGFANFAAKSRDPFRTPMLWSPNGNAGFTKDDLTPWLPITNALKTNVESQEALYTKHDDLSTFKHLAKLRQKESFQWGKVTPGFMGNGIVWFTRKADGFPGYLVVMNLGSTAVTDKFYEDAKIPSKVKVVFHSHDDEVDSVDLSKNAVFLDRDHVIVFQY